MCVCVCKEELLWGTGSRKVISAFFSTEKRELLQCSPRGWTSGGDTPNSWADVLHRRTRNTTHKHTCGTVSLPVHIFLKSSKSVPWPAGTIMVPSYLKTALKKKKKKTFDLIPTRTIFRFQKKSYHAQKSVPGNMCTENYNLLYTIYSYPGTSDSGQQQELFWEKRTLNPMTVPGTTNSYRNLHLFHCITKH